MLNPGNYKLTFGMMVSVLYVSYDGITDPLGQSQVIPYLQKLSKNGYRFWLLSCEKKERFQKNKKIIEGILDNTNIVWCPIVYHKSPPVISTIYDIRKLKAKAIKLHKEHHFNIVHCRSYVAAMIGLHLKQKYRVKFVFDMRGFWVNERVDGKIWDIKNPIFRAIYNYYKRKETQFLENADYIISLTHNAKKEIHSWKLKGQPRPIAVIPCCADLELFSRTNIDHELINHFKKKFHINQNDNIITYLGSIGTWYMLDEMLQFFKYYKKCFPTSRFLFITTDSKDVIIEAANKYNISTESLIITEAQRIEVPVLLSLTTVSVFFIKPVYSKKASSPTKQGEIMGMGIPIICNTDIGDCDTIVKESSGGILVEGFTPNDYKNSINCFKQYDVSGSTQIIKYAQNYFSLDKGVESYINVYEEMLKN